MNFVIDGYQIVCPEAQSYIYIYIYIIRSAKSEICEGSPY